MFLICVTVTGIKEALLPVYGDVLCIYAWPSLDRGTKVSVAKWLLISVLTSSKCFTFNVLVFILAESNWSAVVLFADMLSILSLLTDKSANWVVSTPPDLIIKLPLPSVSIVTLSICILFAFKVPVETLSAFILVTLTTEALIVPVVITLPDIEVTFELTWVPSINDSSLFKVDILSPLTIILPAVITPDTSILAAATVPVVIAPPDIEVTFELTWVPSIKFSLLVRVDILSP